MSSNLKHRNDMPSSSDSKKAKYDSPQQSGIPAGEVTPTKDDTQVPAPETNVPEPIDVDVDPEVVQEMDLPGTAQGGGGAGPGNANKSMPLYKALQPVSSFGNRRRYFRKVHRFATYGFAPRGLKVTLGGEEPKTLYQYMTPMAELPWDRPFFYLNPGEFQLLDDGAHVAKLKVTVIHRGNRIAFETNETATRLATLNQVQNVLTSFGLNLTGWGANKAVEGVETENPMVINALTLPVYSAMVTKFYGVPVNTSTDGFLDTENVPCHNLGVVTPLPNYFCLTTSPVAGYLGVPDLTKHYQTYDGKETINKVIAEFSYEPKIAPLKKAIPHIRFAMPGAFQSGEDIKIPNAGILTDGEVHIQGSASEVTSSAESYLKSIATWNIGNLIEKSQFMRVGPWGQSHHKVQPSVHVGVQAIEALSSTDILGSTENWTNVQATFDVIAEMEISENRETPYAYNPGEGASVPAGDEMYVLSGNDSVPTTHNATFAGAYLSRPIYPS